MGKNTEKFIVHLSISLEDRETVFELLEQSGLHSGENFNDLLAAINEFTEAKRVLEKHKIPHSLKLVKVYFKTITAEVPGEEKTVPVAAVILDKSSFTPKEKMKKENINTKDPELDSTDFDLPPNTPDWAK